MACTGVPIRYTPRQSRSRRRGVGPPCPAPGRRPKETVVRRPGRGRSYADLLAQAHPPRGGGDRPPGDGKAVLGRVRARVRSRYLLVQAVRDTPLPFGRQVRRPMWLAQLRPGDRRGRRAPSRSRRRPDRDPMRPMRGPPRACLRGRGVHAPGRPPLRELDLARVHPGRAHEGFEGGRPRGRTFPPDVTVAMCDLDEGEQVEYLRWLEASRARRAASSRVEPPSATGWPPKRVSPEPVAA